MPCPPKKSTKKQSVRASTKAQLRMSIFNLEKGCRTKEQFEDEKALADAEAIKVQEKRNEYNETLLEFHRVKRDLIEKLGDTEPRYIDSTVAGAEVTDTATLASLVRFKFTKNKTESK